MLGVSREGEALPNPTLAGGGATLDYRLGAWTFTLGDLDVVSRAAATGRRTTIDVPLAAATYTWRLGDYTISDRNRIETLWGVIDNPSRYRNRLMVERRVTGLGPINTIFVSDEAFYQLPLDQWTRNRAQAGFGVGLARGVDLQVYYMRQSDRAAKLGELNIIGAALKIELR